MSSVREPGDLNTLLQAYQETGDGAEAERLLDHLLIIAEEQVIRPTARQQLGGSREREEDVEDVRVLVKTKLAVELRRRRADATTGSIDCLEAYARTITRNACNDLLKQGIRRPETPASEREEDEETDTLIERAADTRPGPDEEAVMRDTLRRLWAEICRRPPRQRAVLLLDWDEVGHVPQLLQLSGAATLAEIAAALALSPEEFGAVWYHLPLDGVGVARHLGIERQQVYNLLMVARRSLRQWLQEEDDEAPGGGTDRRAKKRQ